MLKKVEALKLELSEKWGQWLEEERKIPIEIAAEMGIVSDGNRLAFEYRRKGNLLWLQYRIATKDPNTGKIDKSFACYAPDGRTTLKDAGIPLSFWNEDNLTDLSNLDMPRVITEGQFDAATAREAGASYVGSVPNGAVDRLIDEKVINPLEDKRFQYLWSEKGHLLPGLDTCKQIILATDDDRAGRVLREELAIRLGSTRCWYLTYPENEVAEMGRPCKDLNEVRVHLGLDAVVDVLGGAKPIVPNQLVSFADIPEQVNATEYSSGWKEFDNHFRVVPPQLIVVTGKPNAGKSQWTLALVCNLARLHGLKGAILQFEDSPERNRQDLLQYAEQWRNNENGGIREAPSAWVNRMFRTIAPSQNLSADVDFNLKWLERAIEEAATRHGCRWLVIDPFNELEHWWGRQDTEATYLNRALADLKRLARRFQIALIIVVHPTKEGGKAPSVEDVSLYDVNGGAAWNNKADLGVIVWADDASKTCRRTIKVSKSKDFGRFGIPGVVDMEFNPRSRTYKCVASNRSQKEPGR